MVPLLADRRDVYVLDTDQRPHVRRATDAVEYVVLDESAVPEWTDDERRLFREGLDREGYQRIFDREGVEVFQRQ
jgi:hypothetical protein